MRWRFVLATLSPIALAACGNTSNSRLPVACPRPGLLAEGADLTRYRPGPVKDLTTLEWDAKLTGLSGGCNPGKGNRSIDVTLVASFTVDRGAGAEGRVIDLPWFVAVIDANSEEILNQVAFVERATFARNETRLSGQTGPISLSLPVGETKRASDYRILVSFELTPEDLTLNRRRGPR
jgi:hypothetical protein